MVAEKWLDCPNDIDKVVQMKDKFDSEKWFKYMREYYRTISQGKQKRKTDAPSEAKDSDYHTMLDDLLTGLDRLSVAEKNS